MTYLKQGFSRGYSGSLFSCDN